MELRIIRAYGNRLFEGFGRLGKLTCAGLCPGKVFQVGRFLGIALGGLEKRLVGHEDRRGGIGMQRRGGETPGLVRAEGRMIAHDCPDRVPGDMGGHLLQRREPRPRPRPARRSIAASAGHRSKTPALEKIAKLR